MTLEQQIEDATRVMRTVRDQYIADAKGGIDSVHGIGMARGIQSALRTLHAYTGGQFGEAGTVQQLPDPETIPDREPVAP